MRVTPALLQAAVGCTAERAALFAEHLDAACAHYQIDSHARLAAFLAQISHESGSFTWLREIADGSAYEGRANLGNTQPGDGPRYRGRGLIQITGRDNYRQTARRLQAADAPDFEDFPEALEEPRWAAWSAADWWDSRHLSGLADAGEFVAIGRLINRGNAASTKPANGEADRLARWERAKAALAPYIAPTPEKPAAADPGQPASPSDYMPPGEAPDWAPPQPKASMAPFVIPAVIELAKLIPRLGTMFGGSEVAQRNVAAASVVVDAVVGAVGASNAQEAVEKIAADPAARETASKAVEGVWFQISDGPSGGMDGARKADRATSAAGDMLHSPSFWVTLLLLPLVYLVVGSVVGLWGESWPSDVRAAIATAVVSLIVGGAAGYYWGQSTSRNRSPAP